MAGSDANTTGKILGTLNALIKLADFDEEVGAIPPVPPKSDDEEKPPAGPLAPGLRPEFVYSLQIHLPANGTEKILCF